MKVKQVKVKVWKAWKIHVPDNSPSQCEAKIRRLYLYYLHSGKILWRLHVSISEGWPCGVLLLLICLIHRHHIPLPGSPCIITNLPHHCSRFLLLQFLGDQLIQTIITKYRIESIGMYKVFTPITRRRNRCQLRTGWNITTGPVRGKNTPAYLFETLEANG